MEAAPNKGTADLGYKEDKIGNNIYAHAGNNNEHTDL